MSRGIPLAERIERVRHGEQVPFYLDVQFNKRLRQLGQMNNRLDEKILDSLVDIVEVTEGFFADVSPYDVIDDEQTRSTGSHPPSPKY